MTDMVEKVRGFAIELNKYGLAVEAYPKIASDIILALVEVVEPLQKMETDSLKMHLKHPEWWPNSLYPEFLTETFNALDTCDQRIAEVLNKEE